MCKSFLIYDLIPFKSLNRMKSILMYNNLHRGIHNNMCIIRKTTSTTQLWYGLCNGP